MSRTHVRLGGFVAVSIVLHLLTVLGAGRLDLSARQFGDAPARTELHATLAPGGDTRSGPALPPVPGETDAPEASAQDAAARNAPLPREGAASDTGGLALPAAETWYTAREVDVRAEPLTEVPLRYPESLRGEAVVGKVHLRLFIDERGVVRKMQVAASEPSGMFDEAAKQAWENVSFSPAVKDGRPVKSQKLLELTYQPGLI